MNRSAIRSLGNVVQNSSRSKGGGRSGAGTPDCADVADDGDQGIDRAENGSCVRLAVAEQRLDRAGRALQRIGQLERVADSAEVLFRRRRLPPFAAHQRLECLRRPDRLAKRIQDIEQRLPESTDEDRVGHQLCSIVAGGPFTSGTCWTLPLTSVSAPTS